MNFLKIKKFASLAIATVTLLTASMGAFAAGETQTIQKMSAKEQKQYDVEVANLPNKMKLFEEKKKSMGALYDSKANKTGIIPQWGTYPTRSGVILVTSDATTFGIIHGHAGIVIDKNYTVESAPSGVKKYPNDWATRYKNVAGVSVNTTTATQDKAALDWCVKQINKPYNYLFTNTSTRTKFYCSQLPWAAYKDLHKINLDNDGGIVWPLDLSLSTKVTWIYSK